jgi:catalase
LTCSCHTFKWVNAAGGFVYVKYLWESQQGGFLMMVLTPCSRILGSEQFNMEEATRICGENPDYAKQELWELIESGGAAKWTMKVQVRSKLPW